MTIQINRLDDAFHFEASNEDGRSVRVDAAAAIGGHNAGIRPMQLLLTAIATCSVFDILLILKKQRQVVEDIQITVTGERADAVPAPFTAIAMKFTFFGDLQPEKVAKAVQMGVEKYCSVGATLDKEVRVTSTFEIRPFVSKQSVLEQHFMKPVTNKPITNNQLASTHFETLAVRTQAERTSNREHSVPIYATSSFVFDDAEQARALFADEIAGDIYTRFSNPNNDELIEKLCHLEGTEDGIATASGMAAMFVSMAAFLRAGDHVVVSRSVFGSTHQIVTQLLPRWGIHYTYIDATASMEEWEAAVQPTTKLLFIETPSNPSLDLIDIAALAEIANRHGIILNVDNCFATPYLQTPAKLGAHIVTHSATKFIDGQGRTIGGAILGSKELIREVRFFARHTGPSMSPFNGWILSKSLETLAVRMEKHCQNALQLAEKLQGNPALHWVKYPFLKNHPQYELAQRQMRLGGGIVTFELRGGLGQGQKFIDALQMLSITANLGDTRSIATHPASTTHSKLSVAERQAVGISDGLIRISVGLEHIDDIVGDIEQAIERSAGG